MKKLSLQIIGLLVFAVILFTAATMSQPKQVIISGTYHSGITAAIDKLLKCGYKVVHIETTMSIPDFDGYGYTGDQCDNKNNKVFESPIIVILEK